MTAHALVFGGFFTRLLIGAALGLAIGFEREWRHRPAGAHTTGLVAAAAAAFAAIEPALGGAAERIIANIVTGVGFLAGGVILREGGQVSGLNTAATIWATAAVGALAGVGLYLEALAAAFAVLMINVLAESLGAFSDERPERRQNRK